MGGGTKGEGRRMKSEWKDGVDGVDEVDGVGW